MKLGLGLGWGPLLCRSGVLDNPAPLVMSDFKNGIHEANGASVTVDDIWQAPEYGSVTYDAATDIVAGTGLTYSTTTPSMMGVGPWLKRSLFNALNLNTGFTVVADVNMIDDGIFPDLNIVLSDVDFDYWGFFEDQWGKFIWNSFANVDSGVDDPQTRGRHRIAITLSPTALAYSVNGSEPRVILAPSAPPKAWDFFGLYVSSTNDHGGGSSTSTIEKIALHAVPAFGADLAAMSRPTPLAVADFKNDTYTLDSQSVALSDLFVPVPVNSAYPHGYDAAAFVPGVGFTTTGELSAMASDALKALLAPQTSGFTAVADITLDGTGVASALIELFDNPGWNYGWFVQVYTADGSTSTELGDYVATDTVVPVSAGTARVAFTFKPDGTALVSVNGADAITGSLVTNPTMLDLALRVAGPQQSTFERVAFYAPQDADQLAVLSGKPLVPIAVSDFKNGVYSIGGTEKTVADLWKVDPTWGGQNPEELVVPGVGIVGDSTGPGWGAADDLLAAVLPFGSVTMVLEYNLNGAFGLYTSFYDAAFTTEMWLSDENTNVTLDDDVDPLGTKVPSPTGLRKVAWTPKAPTMSASVNGGPMFSFTSAADNSAIDHLGIVLQDGTIERITFYPTVPTEKLVELSTPVVSGPLVVSDFKNGIYSISGVSKTIDEVLIDNATYGGFDQSAVVDGVGLEQTLTFDVGAPDDYTGSFPVLSSEAQEAVLAAGIDAGFTAVIKFSLAATGPAGANVGVELVKDDDSVGWGGAAGWSPTGNSSNLYDMDSLNMQPPLAASGSHTIAITLCATHLAASIDGAEATITSAPQANDAAPIIGISAAAQTLGSTALSGGSATAIIESITFQAAVADSELAALSGS